MLLRLLTRRSPRAKKALTAADSARDARDWPLAASLYEDFLSNRRDAKDAAVWVQLGHARKESGAYAAALAAYERAISLAPRKADSYLQLGHLLKLMDAQDRARSAYAEALRLDPASKDARHELDELSRHAGQGGRSSTANRLRTAGDAARDARNWAFAAQFYHAYLNDPANARDTDIWIQLGHARKETGEYNEALEAYECAISLAPGTADSHLQLGHLLKLMDDPRRAASAYAEASRLDPALADARDELAALTGIKQAPPSVRTGDGLRMPGPDMRTQAQMPRHTGYPEPQSPVLGTVDRLENNTFRGWVTLKDARIGGKPPGTAVIVTCEGVEVGRASLDRYRPDAPHAPGADPYCGFEFVPPARYHDGRRHLFSFHAAPWDVELLNSPVLFEAPTNAVMTRLVQLNATIDTMSTQLWQMKRDLRSLINTDVLSLDGYDAWARQYQKALRFNRKHAARAAGMETPLVSILCPVYRPRIADFTAAVNSVLQQTYVNWELILVDDNSRSDELSACIDGFCERDPRIRAAVQQANSGISAATNRAIELAKGDYVAFFDHDDLLLDVAVEIMVEAAQRSGAKLLYSDEDKIDDHGRFSDPNLKSDWNYRLLLGQNYVCHFLMVQAETLRQAGPLETRYDGAQDHDLVLRLSELLDESGICHVPEVIYHWRKTPGSTAVTIDNKPQAIDAGAAAIQDHLARRGYDAAVGPLPGGTIYQVDWHFRDEPKIRVVIPFKERVDLTERCLARLLERTRYQNFEVILVDNWSTSEAAAAFCAEAQRSGKVAVLRVEEPFNYSRLNNLACRESDAAFFVFMNNDVFVERDDWLRVLVDEALADPGVAAVGAKLLFADRTVQHGGVILGVGGVADHAYRGRQADDGFYMGRGICAQELSAVTAALMLCRADAFRAAGGFDEESLAVAYNDVDLCLKLRKLGHRVIWAPAVVAEHRESATRGSDLDAFNLGRFVAEEWVMYNRWRHEIDRDPFYNRHFSKEEGIFSKLSSKSLQYST